MGLGVSVMMEFAGEGNTELLSVFLNMTSRRYLAGNDKEKCMWYSVAFERRGYGIRGPRFESFLVW